MKPSLKACMRVLRSIMLLHTINSWASLSRAVNSLSSANTSGITPIVRAPPVRAAWATAPIIEAALPPEKIHQLPPHMYINKMQFGRQPDTRVIPRAAISKPQALASATLSAPADSFDEQNTQTYSLREGLENIVLLLARDRHDKAAALTKDCVYMSNSGALIQRAMQLSSNFSCPRLCNVISRLTRAHAHTRRRLYWSTPAGGRGLFEVSKLHSA